MAAREAKLRRELRLPAALIERVEKSAEPHRTINSSEPRRGSR
jgi:hypothetical protein